MHLEQYVKLFEVFKEESRKSTINLTSIEAQIATVEKWLQDNKLTNTDVLPLEEIVIDTEEDEKELATLTIELENISEKNKKISFGIPAFAKNVTDAVGAEHGTPKSEPETSLL